MISAAQQKRHSINLSAPPTTSNEFQNTQQQQQQLQLVANHRKSNSLDTTIDGTVAASGSKPERYRCVTKYPAMSRVELSLNVGDIIILQKKRPNGWYKGELSRTGQVGLFPANFVELIEWVSTQHLNCNFKFIKSIPINLYGVLHSTHIFYHLSVLSWFNTQKLRFYLRSQNVQQHFLLKLWDERFENKNDLIEKIK